MVATVFAGEYVYVYANIYLGSHPPTEHVR
jgi:hypothetical protein